MPPTPSEAATSTTTTNVTTKKLRTARPKSKTGCGTCKKRHKKCDEARPFCHVCLSKGYKCDGYADSPPPPAGAQQRAAAALRKASTAGAVAISEATAPRRTSPATTTTAGSSSEPTPPPAAVSLPAIVSASPDAHSLELKYLHDFETLTVPQLSGAFNEVFFKTVVLRAARHTPAIRHALIAVGGLHAEAERDASALQLSLANNASNRSAFILDQYGQALRGVVQLAAQHGRHAADVVLSVCLICVLFESLRGNYTAAQLHTQSGVRLLFDVLAGRRRGDPEPHAAGVPVECLTPLLMRLDLQAAEPSDYSAWNRSPLARQLFEPAPVPEAFASVEHSKQVLLEYEYKFLIELRGQMMGHGPDPTAWPAVEFEKLMGMRDRYGRFLGAWSAAHAAMARRLQRPLGGTTRRALAYLSINATMVGIIVALFPMEDEMKFDQYDASFREMLRYASAALGPDNDVKHDDTTRPPDTTRTSTLSFSFDLGLSEPLHWLAMRCRDPTLRRRANALLARCPIREGIWNSQLAAAMGAHAIAIEESLCAGPVRCAADVPREARIQYVRPTYREKLGRFDILLVNKFGLVRNIQVDYEGIGKGVAL